MATERIEVKGARAHNLKNIDVSIPRDQLVVLTGFPDQGNHPLRLIRYMQRGSGAMSSLSPHMPASF